MVTENLRELASEGGIAILANTINQLLIKCHDNNQFGWHGYLRIHGFESIGNEKNADVLKKMIKCYETINNPVIDDKFDRVYRIGKTYMD